MGYLGLTPIAILGSKKITISDKSPICYIQYFECGYQLCVTEICDGGRILNKLYSKHHFTKQ